MAVGFIIVIGTAGMSDHGLLDFKTILIRMIIGLVLMIGGFIVAKFGAPIYIDWD
jgi:hypothetical protein